VSSSFPPSFKDPTTWSGFGQFSVTIATSSEQHAQVQAWLLAEHRLGPRQAAGRSLTQIVYEDGVPVALLQWGACGCFLKPRDAFIGWTSLLCAKRRNLIVNNVRFLVLKATNRTNLASKALAHATKVLAGQWHATHGYEPLLAETFTDADGSAQGTCYKASNWQLLGQTKGFSRVSADFYEPNSTPKNLWLLPLRPDALERLCAAQLAPEHAEAQTEGKGAPSPVKAVQLRALADVLRRVPDPRDDNTSLGIGMLLSLIALGLLCGGTNLLAITRHMHRLTQVQRAYLGLRKKRGKNKIEIPGYDTFRRLLNRLDLEAFAQVLSLWLSEHRGALPAHLAIDGKTIRSTLGTIVTLCDTDEKVPVAIIAAPCGGELESARELLSRASTCLLNAVVSGDALYTNNENARLIVMEKGGDFITSVKGNQPTLERETQRQLDAGVPFFS
jgi:hypothetical protein